MRQGVIDKCREGYLLEIVSFSLSLSLNVLNSIQSVGRQRAAGAVAVP